MTHGTDQTGQRPTPTRDPRPTDPYRAAARYKVASAATTQAARCTDKRDLTDVELNDFQYMQDVMRESRAELAAASRLDLIGATA